ncbi:uncharacterized protein J4E79_007133 [Alternaria viburni]|uniref:uncharacterized protein n=1 Tax=Alternaria viburni TaxID=566460 RepID=UPI0020C325B3|nr:uncharacterized protein J4E79_007133 [Alternaria viburni]KAI4658151.1 hypothetical protein J4E79_007133 [Alternaria viburni]
MISSGFTNAPVTQFLVFGTVIGALLAAITDSRFYLHIQLSFTNSTEVLFAVLTFYQLRVVERIWGSRKFASFLLSTLPYTTLLPPLILTFILRPLTLGRMNHLPAGPTPLLFALLANYYAAIPSTYRYKISPWAASTPSSQQSFYRRSITLTSKSLSYLPPLQLALSQFPGSLLAAAVGWGVGTAYRRDVLPGAARWRVPGWVVGEERKGGFEGLRARLEDEREREGGGAGLATGILAEGAGEARQRRTLGDVVAEQFRGRG